MVFVLAPAAGADIPTLAAIFTHAFSSDELNQTFTPPTTDAEKVKARIESRAERLEHAMKHDPSCRFVKITDEDTKEIIAFAKWHVPTKELNVEKFEARFAEGTNVELIKDFNRRREAIKEIHLNTETDYYLEILATLPSYHGRGAGGMLIRWGLDLADQNGTKTYIEATPYALEIYKRYGWKEVDFIEYNLGDWDKSKAGRKHKTVCLLRPITTAPKVI